MLFEYNQHKNNSVIDYIKNETDLEEDCIGVIYSLERKVFSSGFINIGYADNKAIELGCINLLEGRFPEAVNEAAVTKNVYEIYGNNAVLGESIEIDGNTYTLSGIVEDYGRLWNRREQEIRDGIGQVNVFVSYSNITNQENILVEALLYSKEELHLWETDNVNLYHNINNQIKDLSFYKVPIGFYIMIYILCVLILTGIFLMLENTLVKRGKIYYEQGMDKFAACIFIEIAVVICTGAALGIVLESILVRIVLNGIGRIFAVKLLAPNIFSAIIYAIYAVFIGICFSVYFIFRVNRLVLKKAQIPQKRSLKALKGCRRFGLIRFINTVDNKKSLKLVMIGLISVCIAFFWYSLVYSNYFSFINEHKDFKGKMPTDYDIELSVEVQNSNINEESVYIDNTYETDGVNAQDLGRLAAQDGVDKLYAYKENNKVRIVLDKSSVDAYIDASDYFFDGAYNVFGETDTIGQYFKSEDRAVIKTKIMGYSKEELGKFVKYIKKGEIDYDKLASGEEVILVAPPFTLTTQKDGGIRKDWVGENVENAFVNTALHVGDKITLSYLEAEKPYNGGIDLTTLKQNYKCIDREVKIGAIMEDYVGWFENEATIGETYYIYTLNEALDKIGEDITFNRIRLYIDDNSNSEEVSGIVKAFIEKYPHLRLEDYRNDLIRYRKMKSLIDIFCYIILILVMLTIFINVSCQQLLETRLLMKIYMLLRVNGLTMRTITIHMILKNLLFLSIGLVCAIPVFIFFIRTTMFLDARTMIQFLIPSKDLLITALALLPAVDISAMLPAVILLRMAGYRENLE